jgi:hypothetical protein
MIAETGFEGSSTLDDVIILAPSPCDILVHSIFKTMYDMPVRVQL